MNTNLQWLTRGELSLKIRRSERTIRRWEAFLGPAVLRIEHTVFYDFPAVLEILRRRAQQEQQQTKQKDRKV
jgi:hypothetical protein